MLAKRKLTMYCTPSDEKETPGVSKAARLLDGFFIEACLRMTIEGFNGKTTDLIKMLAHL